jgi:hypothetical protein
MARSFGTTRSMARHDDTKYFGPYQYDTNTRAVSCPPGFFAFKSGNQQCQSHRLESYNASRLIASSESHPCHLVLQFYVPYSALLCSAPDHLALSLFKHNKLDELLSRASNYKSIHTYAGMLCSPKSILLLLISGLNGASTLILTRCARKKEKC